MLGGGGGIGNPSGPLPSSSSSGMLVSAQFQNSTLFNIL